MQGLVTFLPIFVSDTRVAARAKFGKVLCAQRILRVSKNNWRVSKIDVRVSKFYRV